MKLGILDWGVGGFFALHSLQTRGAVSAVYLSDAGNEPYGLQPRTTLENSVRNALSFLADQGADRILVACHSASSTLGRIIPPVPTFGVIDPRAVPPRGRIALLGGRRTIRSGVWRRALKDRELRQRIAQPLSAHIEAGETEGTACTKDLERILAPIADAEILVLACTHYAALRSAIQSRMPHSKIVDPACYVAKHMSYFSDRDDLQIFTTGTPEALTRTMRRMFGTGWNHSVHRSKL